MRAWCRHPCLDTGVGDPWAAEGAHSATRASPGSRPPVFPRCSAGVCGTAGRRPRRSRIPRAHQDEPFIRQPILLHALEALRCFHPYPMGERCDHGTR